MTDQFLAQFESRGYYVFHTFVENHIVFGIRDEMRRLREDMQFRQAGIGRADSFQVNHGQRGDLIHWIDNNEPPVNTTLFLNELQELITQLNRNFYLGIRDFECHFTQYPEGTFYKKHVDRHRERSHRIVSFVFYLNHNWKESDGGQLRIYHEDGTHTDVQPESGALAIFLSEKEHEVLTTHRVRESITGWLLNQERI